MKSLFLGLMPFFLGLWTTGFSAGEPGLNHNCKNAFDQILRLRFDEANDWLAQENKTNPDNSFIPFLENYRDFLRSVITEETAVFEQFKEDFRHRIERVRAPDRVSPYHLYHQAEMHLQMALASFKFRDTWKALFHFYTSNRLIRENSLLFPDFTPNRKITGIHHVFLGSVPDNYSWILKITGMSGDFSMGIRDLESYYAFTHGSDYPVVEAIMILGYVYLQSGPEEDEALLFLHKLDHLPLDNPLFRFVYVLALNGAGMNSGTIKVLEEYPQDENEMPFYFLDFLLGEAKLNRLDEDARFPLNRYVDNFQGLHYVKTCWQKLGWYYLLSGNRAQYEKCIEMVKTTGDNLTDADKQALNEVISGSNENLNLLKARLLFDGGYYQQAMKILLEHHDPEIYRDQQEKLEYFYRLARIYHKLGEEEKAVKYYMLVIRNGSGHPSHFASYSALQLGRIYEKSPDRAKALEFYRLALDLDAGAYTNSIDHKARAGINRLQDH